MDTKQPSKASQARTRTTRQRGNFYIGLGLALLAGLGVVVTLGLFGITGLGIFSAGTAWAMTAVSILLLAGISFVTLISMRRTIELLNGHQTALVDQAARHAELDARVQSQWRAQQVVRDRNQDKAMANLSARQDADFFGAQPQRNHAGASGVRADPFEGGQVYPVIDVEGIGEHYSKLLVDLGVKDTRQLWNADTTYLAGGLKITPGAVASWQCMAELMAVTGIGKQYAELLVRAGVSSIKGLCAETAHPLLKRIHKLEDRLGNRVQGNTIGTNAVQSWINAAQAHHDDLEQAVAQGA